MYWFATQFGSLIVGSCPLTAILSSVDERWDSETAHYYLEIAFISFTT